jgi:hypothetical protein
MDETAFPERDDYDAHQRVMPRYRATPNHARMVEPLPLITPDDEQIRIFFFLSNRPVAARL